MRGDGRLGRAEALGAVDRDRHHPVAGEVVGQVELDRDPARGIGGCLGVEQCQSVEVLADIDLESCRARPVAPAGIRGLLQLEGGCLGFCVVLLDQAKELLGALKQDGASASRGVQVRRPRTVEDIDGVDQLVARHGQHRLVHNDEKHVGPLDRITAGIVDLHRDARGRAGLHRFRRGLGCDVESPQQGRDSQQGLPGRIGGTMGHTVQAGSVIGGSLGGGDNLDLHRELGNMIVGDRHFENRGMVGDLKGAELDDPVVGDRQEAGRRREGRVDEDLCSVARGVALGVGNQVGGFEIDSAARRAASCAGNPAGQLAAAGPPRVIDDVGRDAVAASDVGRELAVDRRLLRNGLAGLRVRRDLGPLAVDVLVNDARRGDLEGSAGNRVAVDVGHHGADVEPVSGPHENTGGANTDIEAGGMDQDVGCRCPLLAVHVEHSSFSGHRGGEMVASRPQSPCAGNGCRWSRSCPRRSRAAARPTARRSHRSTTMDATRRT